MEVNIIENDKLEGFDFMDMYRLYKGALVSAIELYESHNTKLPEFIEIKEFISDKLLSSDYNVSQNIWRDNNGNHLNIKYIITRCEFIINEINFNRDLIEEGIFQNLIEFIINSSLVNIVTVLNMEDDAIKLYLKERGFKEDQNEFHYIKSIQ